MAHKVKSAKHQPQISQTTMGQFWLGKTKPKKAFRLTPKFFQKVATEFLKKFIQRNFLLTD